MRVRWETESMYCEACWGHDLLQEWVVMISRGGKRGRLGALQTIVVQSKEEGMKKLEALNKIIIRYGYARMPSPVVEGTHYSVSKTGVAP